VISPHVGFENRGKGGSIVANNLHTYRLKIFVKWRWTISYFLFDKENCDMWGDGNLTHGDMPEKSRLPDAIATDDAITPAVCECEGCPRAAKKFYLAIR
jgi:hypothetical protein